ncbi:hypothetical protein BC938DRAFT_475603 [Jimgerdemannia flammicorona]|uniref:DNA-directed RNA polymerase n=1 Tax=Jimgerdemannia flammicorona TaxID=994334 RepID=A0A433QRI1_9FUNG|nr:hypothetical protein BC938DRAFT_475603 [Jimgerdemannia flammicorona]
MNKPASPTGMWLPDVNKIVTNDIAAVLGAYDVEAGRAAHMKEMLSVFEVYDIDVDLRHLTLIADYMVSTYRITR